MSLPSDVTVNNLKDFYAMILPYLNVGNGGTSDTPLGQVAFFDDTVAPAGWLIADGTVYNISDYPDLATQYERVHGSKNFYGGNGTTTFAVPDWQGEFLRASGTNGHSGQGSGAAVGVHQDGTEIPFIGTTTDDCQVFSRYGGEPQKRDSDIGSSTGRYASTGSSFSSTNASRYTSRPTNTSLLLCIKAVPSSEMNTYSLTERRIGTWIDGKPVYQKTVQTNSSFTERWTTFTNISNIEKVINAIIHVKENTNNTYGIRTDYYVEVSGINGDVAVFNHTGYTVLVEYITLQYTKTTD